MGIRKMITVLVCGDRHWPSTNKEPIRRELMKQVGKSVIVVHGACSGVDTIAGQVAKEFGFEVHEYPVTQEDWKSLGRAAGPVRNQRMITREKVDLVLAFHPNVESSRGTKDMISRARRAGIRVEIYSS